MDTCKVCNAPFKRHYRQKGQRKIYCSKECNYADSFETRVCPTCNKSFQENIFSKRKGFCSKKCIPRIPCLLCGKIIFSRFSFYKKDRSFCSRKCASAFNRTLQSKKEWQTLGFTFTIIRHGALLCEQCKIADLAVLEVHHKKGRGAGNTMDNLITLCANCHARTHSAHSAKRDRSLKKAQWLAAILVTPEK